VEYFYNPCELKSVENVENSIFLLYIAELIVEKIVDFLFKTFFIKKWFLFSTISIILIVTILIMGELTPSFILKIGEISIINMAIIGKIFYN
jgi:hypothetical protein